jgi:hypothetical protein
MHAICAAVLGFSLERALESPLSRRLAENNEPCKQSCDSSYDRACDQQDSSGKWKLSCDLHPTTSCDDDCHYPPPPPLDPWMGASGTYPSPPPPPPPPDMELLEIAWIYFLVALLICLCCTCYSLYAYSHRKRDGPNSGSRDTREGIAYWCCCFLPCWRTGGDFWDQEERDVRNELKREAGTQPAVVPPVMLK